MSKTLVISYIPRTGSNTKKILDAYTEALPDSVTVTTVDLAIDSPVLLDSDRVNAYVSRNYMGAELTIEQAALLAPLDAYMEQVLAADTIVLAYPMYNFSLPAAVKAWFDGVIQAGQTFAMTSKGVEGKLAGKKAVIISTAGSQYVEGSPMATMEHSHSLAEVEFRFMGITDITTIFAGGSGNAEHFPATLDNAIAQAVAAV